MMNAERGERSECVHLDGGAAFNSGASDPALLRMDGGLGAYPFRAIIGA